MTQLVGILNITPDSFSDGGKFFSVGAALSQAEKLFKDGAALIDIGAVSTRPSADPVSLKEEWRRLEPVLTELIPKYPGKISVDSFNPETIKKALAIGPVIVNDVTGLNNPAMLKLVIALKPTVIISHLPGTDVQIAHTATPISLVEDVKNDLLKKAKFLEKNGLKKEQIILDPGIGFGKTVELNRELLKFAQQVPDYKVMIGYSKKRFLGEHRMELEPNLEAGKIAIESGATYLRVHDVLGHTGLVVSGEW